MLKFEIIHPREDETYQITYDDKCLVVKNSSEEKSPKIWISKSMANWIALNFADKTNIEFVMIKERDE